jgi:hypothetical protein
VNKIGPCQNALEFSHRLGRKRTFMGRFVSATKTNPASVGSGGCSGRDEAGLRTLLL